MSLDRRFRGVRRFLLAACLLAGANSFGQEQDTTVLTSVSKASIDLYAYAGRSVRFSGTVKRILAGGIPLRVLLTTDRYSWVGVFYTPDDIPEDVIAPGASVVVEGTLLPAAPEMIDGTRQKLVQVMADGVRRP